MSRFLWFSVYISDLCLRLVQLVDISITFNSVNNDKKC